MHARVHGWKMWEEQKAFKFLLWSISYTKNFSGGTKDKVSPMASTIVSGNHNCIFKQLALTVDIESKVIEWNEHGLLNLCNYDQFKNVLWHLLMSCMHFFRFLWFSKDTFSGRKCINIFMVYWKISAAPLSLAQHASAFSWKIISNQNTLLKKIIIVQRWKWQSIIGKNSKEREHVKLWLMLQA